MKEAVELIEAIEKTGLIYAYGENYCYMPAPYEMKKLYAQGEIGEFEYGECEYIHNCESIWHSITYGERDHWRNNMYSTFYCTRSLGPVIHMTGLRPVSVVGFEGTKNERKLRDKAVRELWRNDTACSDPKAAGDMLLQTFSKGTPEIDDEVYERMKNLWDAECESSEENYRNAALNQGAK